MLSSRAQGSFEDRLRLAAIYLSLVPLASASTFAEETDALMGALQRSTAPLPAQQQVRRRLLVLALL
jgi:hypothetical protein